MELQIQDLISEIKKDGIDEAKKEAERIIEAAKKDAAIIVANAKSEAQLTFTTNSQKLETLKQGAIESVEQAKRDAILLFKEAIHEELNKILSADASKVVDGEALSKLIISSLNGEDPSKYEVEVSNVTEGLKASLKKEIEQGLDIKLANKERTGFKLSMKDGSGYFDLSDEEISELLKPLFSSLDI